MADPLEGEAYCNKYGHDLRKRFVVGNLEGKKKFKNKLIYDKVCRKCGLVKYNENFALEYDKAMKKR
jgi:hypothetical protein